MYFSKLIQFQQCRRALQKEWDVHQSERLEAYPPIDRVETESGEFNPDIRQQSIDGSVVKTLDDLFDAAELALPVFTSIFREIANQAMISEVDVKVAPLKAKTRALEKANDDYAKRTPGPGVSWLFDIVRGMILCENEYQVCELIDAFTTKSLSSDGIEVIRFKNRFKNPTPGGYRDCNMNVLVRVNEQFVHVCEVQIHLKNILLVSKAVHSHAAYEFFRTYFRGNADAVAERLRIVTGAIGDLVDSMSVSDSESDNVKHARQMMGDVVSRVIEVRDGEKMKRLVDLLTLMCDFEHAILLMERIVGLVIERHGVASKDTIAAQSQLVNLLIEAGKLREAQVVLESALEQAEAVYGQNHADHGVLIQSLAYIYQTNRDFVRAKELYERALDIMEPALGELDGNVLSCWNNLASIMCEGFNDLEKGKELFQKVYIGRQKSLGDNHPHITTSLNNLGAVCAFLRQEEESRKYKMLALERSERFYGPEHLTTLMMKSNLGNELDLIGDSAGAEKILLEALDGRSRILGLENFDTIVTMSNVGEHYLYVNNALLSEKYLLEAKELCDRIGVEPTHGFYQHLLRLISTELPIVLRSAECSANFANMPEDATHPDIHPHKLVREASVPYPRGVYYCDICHVKGFWGSVSLW